MSCRCVDRGRRSHGQIADGLEPLVTLTRVRFGNAAAAIVAPGRASSKLSSGRRRVFRFACGSWSQRSGREGDQLHGAPWSAGLSQMTVGCAQRPVERLGEGDVPRVVGGDVCSQLEGSAQ